MAAPQVRVEIYDKTFKQVATLGDPKFVTVIPRFNAPGQATFSVRSNHPHIGKLVADGARVRFVNELGEHILSGWVNGFRGTGPEKNAFTEFDITDDFAVLRTILGWVVPSAAITAQGSAGTNWTMVGPAETVLKTAVAQNGYSRLGLPITMSTTQGRGATVKASLRMQPLYDRLFPVVDGAGIEKSGIGVEMRLIPNFGLELYVYTPTVRPQPLTELSGIITSWSYSIKAASVTRGVGGGQGEGTLRVWREKSLPEMEARIGWKHEAYRDARDTPDPTVIYSRLDETFAENGEKAGLDITLSETANFRYGKALKVGDTVSIVVGGRTFTETLNEATISWTADGGFVTRPRVGEHSDDADTGLLKVIRSIARSIQNRNTGQ